MTDQPARFGAAIRNGKIQMMIGGMAFVAAAALGAFFMQGAGSAAPVATTDRAAIEAIVRDYILEHPEILPQAMERLQAKRLGSVIDQNRAGIETPFAGAWEGAAKGDVVLVEFFDYACGYCRKTLPELARLLAEDKGLKIVYRELPILSDQSADAAKVSLLAAEKGQYMRFHRALYDAGKVTRDSIFAAAAQVGIDRKAAEAAMVSEKYGAEVDRNISLAQTLQATGTPTFVVGDQVLNGAVGFDALKSAIAAARGK
ncbi:DsbA family protein [Sphingobium algorifonticola]|uniref:DsbA family protein n=1 Tax=Sphingobium algorifonticola TaxID=2008318 RepID=A0A437J853_9SPHN|nr:DsbA family protein [Sphingobium algorifonticola]RVT41687.1 DsbA family protein [Sphingobium algorifonticola]